MRRGDYIMSGYVAVVCAAMGLVFWLVLGPHGRVYTNTRFHFTVQYPSGWQANESITDTPTVSLPPTQGSENGSAGSAESAPFPLVLTITRGGAAGPAPTSAFTVTIWDLSNPIVAAQAQVLTHNASLHAATIAGLGGLASTPARQVRYFDTAIPTPDSSPDALASPTPQLTPQPSPQPPPTTACTPAPGTTTPGTACTIVKVVDVHTDYFLVHGGYVYQVTTDAISGDAADAALQSMVASFRLTA